jgi:GT2 family glycosyltransferase
VTDARAQDGAPRVTVVIVTWQSRELARACIDSISAQQSVTPFVLVVVDNASTDGTVDLLARDYPWVRVIANDRNLGFAGANNLALREIETDYAYLINPDVIAGPGFIDRLVEFMDATPTCGACGPRILTPDGAPSTTYGDFPTPASALLRELEQLEQVPLIRALARSWGRLAPYGSGPVAVDYVCGAAIMLRQSAIDGVGLLSDAYFLYFEEVDWCRRAADAGWQRAIVPTASIIHIEGGTMRDMPDTRSAHYWTSLGVYFARRYGPLVTRLTFWLMEVTWRARRRRLRILRKPQADGRADVRIRLFRDARASVRGPRPTRARG